MITSHQLKTKRAIYSKYPDLQHGQILLLSDKDKRNSFAFVLGSDLFDPTANLKELAWNEPTLRAILIECDIASDLLFDLISGQAKDFSVPFQIVVDQDSPGRALASWSIGAENDTVASARLIDDLLYVKNGALQLYRIPIRSIPGLATLNEKTLNNFIVHEFGHYIWWPDPDVHVTFDDIRCLLDQDYKKEHLLNKVKYFQNYGAAIRTLRERCGVSKVKIENETGLSARQLQRYENEGHEINLKAVEKLAMAHAMTVTEYLGELAKIAGAVRQNAAEAATD